jgi:hypothetical protein
MLEHWPQGLQIGLPNLMVSFFEPWGQYKASSAFISRLGQIEKFFFSLSALTPSVKRALVVPYKVCLCYFKIILLPTKLAHTLYNYHDRDEITNKFSPRLEVGMTKYLFSFTTRVSTT